MSDGKGWTKGTWYVSELGVVKTRGLKTKNTICYIYGNRSKEGQENDARLIAAAPDLAEALDDLIAAYEDEGNEGNTHDAVVIKARAALARAGGE